MINCNRCKKISITEKDQHATKETKPHICTEYKQQVFHHSCRPGFHEHIFPCVECEKDGFSHFAEREVGERINGH